MERFLIDGQHHQWRKVMSSKLFQPSTDSSDNKKLGSKSPITEFGSNLDNIEQLKSDSTLDFIGSEVAWATSLLMEGDDITNNALNDCIPKSDSMGALSILSSAISGVQSFQNSDATTTGGRTLDAMLDASGALMIGANPIVGTIDSLLPEEVRISTLLNGGSTALATMTEGLLTGNTDGMESFIQHARDGQYTWLMKEAVEAGEFWSTLH